VSFKVQTDSFSFQSDSFSLWTGTIFLFETDSLSLWTRTVFSLIRTIFSLIRTIFSLNLNYFLFEIDSCSLWTRTVFSLKPNYFLFGLELFSLGNWFIFFQPFIRLGPLMRQQLILLPILRESVLYQRKQLVRLCIVHSAYQNKGPPSVRKIFREKAITQEKI
jgi:hypothetical protein